MMTPQENMYRSTIDSARRIGLCVSLSLLGLLLLTGVASADTLLTDPEGISGFELYGNGIFWWDALGMCSGEFRNSATVRVRGVTTASTRKVAKSCDILQSENSSVVRDGSYVYYTSGQELHRKAVNAAESGSGQLVSTAPYSPTLLSGETGAYLLMAEGYLYWERYNPRFSIGYIIRIPADGSAGPEYVATTNNRVRKMMWDGHGGGALVWLNENGTLYRQFLDQKNPVRLAARVADFAIVTRRYFTLPPTPPVTSIYAAIGTPYPSPGGSPGRLLLIDIDTGVSKTIYTASGSNQVLSVTTDSDYTATYVIGFT